MEQILWGIAIPVTLIYIAQAIVTFLGVDSHDGISADFNGDLDHSDSSSIQLFTIKNAIAFLLGLSWGTLIGLKEAGLSNILSILLGIGLGLLIVFLQILIFAFFVKLERKQIPSLKDAIGKSGTVYLTIPAYNGGRGKVSLTINGTNKTLDAITSDKAPLPTGSQISVVDVINDSTLLVKKLNS